MDEGLAARLVARLVACLAARLDSILDSILDLNLDSILDRILDSSLDLNLDANLVTGSGTGGRGNFRMDLGYVGGVDRELILGRDLDLDLVLDWFWSAPRVIASLRIEDMERDLIFPLLKILGIICSITVRTVRTIRGSVVSVVSNIGGQLVYISCYFLNFTFH